MSDLKISFIVHGSGEAHFANTMHSIMAQSDASTEIVIINPEDANITPYLNELKGKGVQASVSAIQSSSYAELLNAAFKAAKAPYLLYLDNRDTEIQLKQGIVELLFLEMQYQPNAGMVYADYELHENGTIKEVHLLKHHPGRLRDNQDYGKVFLFNKQALSDIGYADEALKFNTLYDLRLKLSEKHRLVHIANRYAGSLYAIKSSSKAHNVFDYLLAGKESQQEAEAVLSEHLKRINAYLEPGAHYSARPNPPETANLKASVIIPVNNRPEFIGTAIESIQTQTVSEVEAIIVVNGGVEDPTIAEVERYQKGGDKYNPDKPEVQLLVFDINNLGLCLNMGAQVAKGTYYVQLDSDDRLKPDAVEKILSVYESDPKIGMVIGSYEVWQLDENGNYSRMEELPVVTHDEWTEENGRNNLLRINGAGAPRSIPIALIREMGFSMNEEPYARNYGEDYGMVLRISERHRIGRVWDAIYEVVRHSGGTDHSIDQATIDRNDEAKDFMRLETIQRRQIMKL